MNPRFAASIAGQTAVMVSAICAIRLTGRKVARTVACAVAGLLMSLVMVDPAPAAPAMAGAVIVEDEVVDPVVADDDESVVSDQRAEEFLKEAPATPEPVPAGNVTDEAREPFSPDACLLPPAAAEPEDPELVPPTDDTPVVPSPDVDPACEIGAEPTPTPEPTPTTEPTTASTSSVDPSSSPAPSTELSATATESVEAPAAPSASQSEATADSSVSSEKSTEPTPSQKLGIAPLSGMGTLSLGDGPAAAPGGNWGATSLAPSASWSTAGNTGGFSWSYPLDLTSAAAGPKPSLSLSYSSASSDGRTDATNNQTSWVGEGFDLTSDFIERTYVPCASDMEGQANNPTDHAVGDLCWGPMNATMMLGGGGGEMVRTSSRTEDGTEFVTWKPERFDGTVVEEVIPDGRQRYWQVRTPDGTLYVFGKGSSTSSSASTRSAWTVPVYGNHPGEPGHAESYGGSRERQVWRWNLDYVEDRFGNTMSYFYDPDQAWYGANNDASTVWYHPGGYLARIEYGTRKSVSTSSSDAPGKVVFGVEEDRSDVPESLVCRFGAGEEVETIADRCDKTTPVFFTTARLSSIESFTQDSTGSHPVDRWELSQSWMDPKDSSLGKRGRIMRLDRIRHIGKGGTSTTTDDIVVPDVVFGWSLFKNRVRSIPGMWRPRLSSVLTDTGATIGIAYTAACDPDRLPDQPVAHPSPAVALCMPAGWHKDIAPDAIDWFQKYKVSTVTTIPSSRVNGSGAPATGSEMMTTSFEYGGGTYWAKPTGAVMKPDEVTFQEFRGYRWVKTTTGRDGDHRQISKTTYYRGDGQKISAGPVAAANRTSVVDDVQARVGETFAQASFSGGHKVTESINESAHTEVARYPVDDSKPLRVASNRLTTSTGHGFSYRADGYLDTRTQTITRYTSDGQVRQVNNLGKVAADGEWTAGDATADDNMCTRYQYGTEVSSALASMPALVWRTQTRATACPEPTDGFDGVAPKDLVSDQLDILNGDGVSTQSWSLNPDSVDVGSTDTGDVVAGTMSGEGRRGFVQVSATMYDALGRPTRVTSHPGSLNRSTETHYSPEGAGLLAATTVTTDDLDGSGWRTPFETTTIYNARTGVVTDTYDINNLHTSGRYDALGRLISVTYPQHREGGSAGIDKESIKYQYVLGVGAPRNEDGSLRNNLNNGINAVTTRTLGADGSTYHVDVTLSDGLNRVVQTQTESAHSGDDYQNLTKLPDVRVVSHSIYDTAGRLIEQQGPWTTVDGGPKAELLKLGPSVADGGSGMGDPGRSTTYTYDGLGRRTAEIARGANATERSTTKTVYDGSYTTVLAPGDVKPLTDSGGTSTTSQTDSRGRVVAQWQHTKAAPATTDQAGRVLIGGKSPTESTAPKTVYDYDRAGHLMSMTDPANDVWSYEYDILGRQTRVDDPDAGVTETSYYADGQTKTVTSSPGTSSEETIGYTYDKLGRLERVIDGGTELTPNNTRVLYQYDGAPDDTSLSGPMLGVQYRTVRFQGGDEYVTKVPKVDDAYRTLSTSTFVYPRSGDVTTPAGIWHARVNPGGTTAAATNDYTYTADGQVASEKFAQLKANGTEILSSETVTTHYDKASMARWMGGGFSWGTYVAESRYTPLGKVETLDLGNTYGTYVTRKYDHVTGLVTGLEVKREGLPVDVSLTYSYNDAGDITSIADRPAADAATKGETQCFTYDSLRRLTQAWTPASNACSTAADAAATEALGGPAGYGVSYTYDGQTKVDATLPGAGNRTKEVFRDATKSTSTTNDYFYEESGNAGPHALTRMVQTITVGQTTGAPMTREYEYSKAGQQVKRAERLDTAQSVNQLNCWDPEGNLSKVLNRALKSGETAEETCANGVVDEAGEAGFVYDGDGNRMFRTDASGTTVYLPGGQEMFFPVKAADPAAATRYYSFAGETVAVRTGRGFEGVESLVNDHHGTPIASVPNVPNLNSRKAAFKRVYSTPFGDERGAQNITAADRDGNGTPGDHGFLGAPTDVSTGLTQMGARYYDTETGMFISADPILKPGDADHFNAYAYSFQNPLTYSDPTGLAGSMPDGEDCGGRCDGDDVREYRERNESQQQVENEPASVEEPVSTDTTPAGPSQEEVEEAEQTLAKTVTDVALEVGWDLLKDFVGWNDLMGCMDADIASCAMLAIGITPWGKGLKAIKALGKVVDAGVALFKRQKAARKTIADAKAAEAAAATVCPIGGGRKSFSGDTPVLMADGTHKPIEDVRVGDLIWATDPVTEVAGPRKVTHTWVHLDDLYPVEIDGVRLVTTEDHPFWSVTDRRWEDAQDLASGELVLNATGNTATVTESVETGRFEVGLAYNLTVAGIHTYHVANAGVLVHNTNCGTFGHLSPSGRLTIPNVKGVYRIVTNSGRKYIGKATDIHNRVHASFRKKGALYEEGERAGDVRELDWIEMEGATDDELFEAEADWIDREGGIEALANRVNSPGNR